MSMRHFRQEDNLLPRIVEVDPQGINLQVDTEVPCREDQQKKHEKSR